jgi:thioredoxin reductase
MSFDSIVVGAGPAGLSAALMLGRARRRVLVLDSGEYRNHAARHMHGVLGHDGLDPADLRAKGLEEIARYGVEVRRAAVDPATAAVDADGVDIAGERARSLVIATGLVDDTPRVDGFDAIYGVSAHTCPYCDGWEHRDRRIAVLAPVERGDHLGHLLRQWSSDVVVVTDGGDGIGPDEQARLAEVGVPVLRERVTRFAHDDGRLTAIELEGREPLERDALFFFLAMRPRAELAVALGCELTEAGYVVAHPMTRATSVERVFGAGNVADPSQNVPMAIADGARAGAYINFQLVEEGVIQPR